MPGTKLIPNTKFSVDAFRYPGDHIRGYFLTHAHGDHYTGLNENWRHGPIWCTEVTGRLVCHITGVSSELIHVLPLNTETTIDGVRVTAVDANHCPGAAILLFSLPSGEKYVHCGDMRYCASMQSSPHLQAFRSCDAVFLDTTYCAPKHTFPLQEVSVSEVARLCKGYLDEDPSRLILISSYTIGKEKIFMEVARRCGVKLCVTAAKFEVMQLLPWPEDLPLHRIFTTDPASTRVHCVTWNWLGETWPYFRPNYANMELFAHMQGATAAVGFVPTGWTYQTKTHSFPVHEKPPWKVHLIPYSEHSSFTELQEFVGFLRPRKVVPTVGVSGDRGDANGHKLASYFRHLCDNSGALRSFIGTMTAKAAPGVAADLKTQPAGQRSACNVVMEDQAAAVEAPVDHSRREVEDIAASASDPPAVVLDLIQSGQVNTGAEQCGSKSTASCSKGNNADRSKDVDTLLSIIGSEGSTAVAMSLLEQHKGSIEAAVNAYFDPPVSGRDQQSDHTKMQRSKLKGSSGSGNGSKTQSPARSKAVKRSATSKVAGSPASKLQRQQKAITSFFQAGSPAKVPIHEDGSVAEDGAFVCSRLDVKVEQAEPGILLHNPKTEPTASPVDVGADAYEHVAPGSADAEAADVHPAGPAVTASAATLRAGATDACCQRGGSSAAGGAADTAVVNSAVAEADDTAAADCAAQGAPAGDASKAEHGQAIGVTAAASEIDAGAQSLPLDKCDSSALLRFNPEVHACWKHGVVPYMHIAATFAAMDNTTKRLRIGDALTNMFRSVLALCPEDLEAVAYLTVGKLAPDYAGCDLQVGGATVSSAIAESTGVAPRRMSEMYVEAGDLGDVAEKCKSKQRMLIPHAPLTARAVFSKLHEIANTKGTKSAQRKQAIISGLLRASRGPEVKYVVRTLIQNLRVGANWRSVVPALGRAALCDHARKTQAAFPGKADLTAAAEVATEAFHSCPSLTEVTKALLLGGVQQLKQLGASVGVPLKPMLAKITTGLDDCVEQIIGNPALIEYKYDGQRAQIHVSASGQVHIFSRNCENKTPMFPDVAKNILAACAQSTSDTNHPDASTSVPVPCHDFIVDSELVAVDRTKEGKLRAFQDLSTRARNGITDAQVNVDVCVFLFDLLFVDGRGMMQSSFRDRRHALTKIFPNLRQGHVEMAHGFELVIPAAGGQSTQPAVADNDQSSEGAANLHTPSQKEVAEQQQSAQFAESRGEGLRTWIKQCGPEQAGTLLEHTLLQALAVGAEGLMLKFLDTRCAYQPSKRSDSWLKLKKDYCEGLRDSLDLVPIGAWYGNGRKAGWYSPYLLACWDPEAEEFQSVCRVMSGFSDAFYTAAKERFDSKHLIPGPKPYYNTGESPNVWFDAAEVWEIRGADITLSPVHKAAVGKLHESRGCSLRFPRFIQIRDDKSPEDASSGDYIVDLYNAQARKRDDS